MLQIHPIAAFNDNYFWLIQPDSTCTDAYIVDPGHAETALAGVEKYGLNLKGILITHHHHDHIDGAQSLSSKFNIPIYGPQSPKIPQITQVVRNGEQLLLGQFKVNVIALPGHTQDHIAYYMVPENTEPRLFSGDTLFAAGCGRLFDGTAKALFASLQTIAALPENTLIYAAHEYTLANLRFALYIEPDNNEVSQRQGHCEKLRSQGLPTLPTQLLLEKRTNPFLRCHIPAIRLRAEQLVGHELATEEAIFTSLRQAKDHF